MPQPQPVAKRCRRDSPKPPRKGHCMLGRHALVGSSMSFLKSSQTPSRMPCLQSHLQSLKLTVRSWHSLKMSKAADAVQGAAFAGQRHPSEGLTSAVFLPLKLPGMRLGIGTVRQWDSSSGHWLLRWGSARFAHVKFSWALKQATPHMKSLRPARDSRNGSHENEEWLA